MIKPIENWKDAWKFASVQISTVGFIFFGVVESVSQTWISLPPAIMQHIPHSPVVSQVILGLVLVSRLFKVKDKK